MPGDARYWADVVRRELYHLDGRRYSELEKALEKMDVQALMDLHRLFQNVQQTISSAKRTVQMWPGGPRMRM